MFNFSTNTEKKNILFFCYDGINGSQGDQLINRYRSIQRVQGIFEVADHQQQNRDNDQKTQNYHQSRIITGFGSDP